MKHVIKGNNTQIVKKANKCLVLDAIRASEGISIEDIVWTTHLSRPTINKIITELLDEDIIQKNGYRISSGGRHPVLYSLNTHSWYAVGIDFEFPPMRMIVTDMYANIVFSKKWEHKYGDSEDAVVKAIIFYIRECMESIHISSKNIVGIALGIPGTVDIENNVPTIITRIPQFQGKAINKIISDELGVDVYVRNDAHLFAMIDSRMLELQNKNLLYIAYRTGIGMAILINGVPYEGNLGNSGFIGHTIVNHNGEKCICGNRGCLELYCTKGKQIEKFRIKKRIDHNISITFNDVLSAAESGDETAIEILTEASGYLGIAIFNAVMLFDIDIVIVGDLICNDDNVFFTNLVDTVNRNAKNYSKEITLLKGKMDDNNYAIGGCFFIIDQFFSEPKLTLRV
jgi:predicted NBD/HSP70 family sugar kinase/predicted transcriptional regulator